MMTECEQVLSCLVGRPREIAETIRREVLAAAPYAEMGISLGVPTWSFHDRVVSLIPFPRKCNLHFWDGDALADVVPGKLQGTGSGTIRFLELHSMLDVDSDVKLLLREAFAHKVTLFAQKDGILANKAVLL